MYCSKCGELLVETAAFCHSCGEKVNNVEISAAFVAPKKLPDPAFGAKPIIKSEPVPVSEPEQPKTALPEEPAIETVQHPQPKPEYEYGDSGEIGDIVIRMLKDDSDDANLIQPEESIVPEPEKIKKKIWPVVIIGILAIFIIFSVLTVALPEVKPFKNIRELLGLSSVSESLPETPTDTAEETGITETETSTQTPTAEYGAKLRQPHTPNLMSAGKVYIDISVAENFGKDTSDICFSADFTDENQTVFYIPSYGENPDMIYTVNETDETYSAYTGAYGRFYSETKNKSLDDAPDKLILCIDILEFSFNKDYDGEFEARGAEELESGFAHIYALDDGTVVHIDAASGVYVKAEHDGEELFTVNAVMTGSDVRIPDYRNNMMEE